MYVQEVHVEAFRDLKIMVELDLSNNNITEIVQDTFKGNERLQTLTVSHNQVLLDSVKIWWKEEKIVGVIKRKP